MDLLQVREKHIFETLKRISRHEFVVIGGYAVNAYTLPRFSVDCDIVLRDKAGANQVAKELEAEGYTKQRPSKPPYKGGFIRYKKKIFKNFFVSIDILSGEVVDRQTNAVFSSAWIFDNSALRVLSGKTIAEKLKVRVLDISALIAMKIVSCRRTDIRDVFMLIAYAEDAEQIRKEVSNFCDFGSRYKKLKDKIVSRQFKDDLQGVFGYIHEGVFEKHKKKILELE